MPSLRDDAPLWVHTPLLHSQQLSNILDADNVQPSQSFKFRGISLFAQRAKQKSPDTHLVIASGGNAGLAAACAARAVGLKCSVYLPFGLDSRFLATLKEQGAEIIEEGVNYAAALKKAREAVARDEKSIEVSAYDDVTLWEGHASMIEEIASDLKGIKPDAIFCSVGGGGLLAGVMVGCKNVDWDDVLIGTFETIGSDCFYQSISANRQKTGVTDPSPKFTTFHDPDHGVELVRLNAITSIASSLGASSPAPGAVRMALDRQGPVKCALVPDLLSMQIAAKFAGKEEKGKFKTSFLRNANTITEDHKFLVELACSTTLVPAYNKEIFDRIVPPPSKDDKKRRTVVFIVCGGTKISIAELDRYSSIAEKEESKFCEIFIDGEAFQVSR